MKKKLIICLATLFFVGNFVFDVPPVYSETNQSVTVHGRVQYGSVDLDNALVMFISGNDTTSTLTNTDGWYDIELPMVSPYVEEAVNPQSFKLYQNYPNPFNPSTVIEYDLAQTAYVTLDIYNITGQKVRRLRDGYEKIGTQRIWWDGRDNSGKSVGAGIYLYSLRAGNVVQTKKMILLDGGGSHQQNSTTPSNSNLLKGVGKRTETTFDIVVARDGFETFREENFILPDNEPIINKDFQLQNAHPTIETPYYSLIANPIVIKTYVGGGGLSFLELSPAEPFQEEVHLAIISEPNLHLELTTTTLSRDKTICEITIKPDLTTNLNSKIVKVVSTNTSNPDTLNIFAKFIYFPGEQPIEYTEQIKNSFIIWLESYHPELGITTGQEWFGYNKNPDFVGGVTFTFLNDMWDMTIVYPSIPIDSVRYMLLRERGYLNPFLAAIKELDGSIHEIPVPAWGTN